MNAMFDLVNSFILQLSFHETPLCIHEIIRNAFKDVLVSENEKNYDIPGADCLNVVGSFGIIRSRSLTNSVRARPQRPRRLVMNHSGT